MSTLSDFTRPSDPIIEADLEAEILEITGLTVSAIVNPDSIDVTGIISETDRDNIQTAINEYAYENPQGDSTKIDKTMISDVFPMSFDSNKIVTENVAKQGDQKNKRKAWVSGVQKDDSYVYVAKATSTSGSATFYITNNGTSSGSAVFNNVYSDSIAVIVYGGSGNYQTYAPTVSDDKKSVTVSISQTTTILGVLTFNGTAAAGLDCRLYVMGD